MHIPEAPRRKAAEAARWSVIPPAAIRGMCWLGRFETRASEHSGRRVIREEQLFRPWPPASEPWITKTSGWQDLARERVLDTVPVWIQIFVRGHDLRIAVVHVSWEGN